MGLSLTYICEIKAAYNMSEHVFHSNDREAVILEMTEETKTD